MHTQGKDENKMKLSSVLLLHLVDVQYANLDVLYCHLNILPTYFMQMLSLIKLYLKCMFYLWASSYKVSSVTTAPLGFRFWTKAVSPHK